jgi:hypothetical protein
VLTSCSSITPSSSIHSRPWSPHPILEASWPGLSVTVLQSTRRTLVTTPPPQACLSPWQGHSASATLCVYCRREELFVPEENADAVAKALAEVGAGVIGDYTECTFRTLGRGTFRGGEGASPYLGEKGRLEEVQEVRIETVVAAHTVGRAVNATTAAHPYEEVALDVYPVEGSPDGCGFGRVGTLPERLTAEELREHVSESLGFPSRLLADPGRRIETVAVLGGSGGSFIPEVAASGAHAYVTGDVDYHEALHAESLDLAVIDAGHAATELPSLEPLALRLTELIDVPVEVSRVLR